MQSKWSGALLFRLPSSIPLALPVGDTQREAGSRGNRRFAGSAPALQNGGHQGKSEVSSKSLMTAVEHSLPSQTSDSQTKP